MKHRILVILALLANGIAIPDTASALTTQQFMSICEAGNGPCSEHPILNAYIGGALDLIAVLDEETDYLGEVYCGKPDKLFDVTQIIRYIEANQKAYADKNAMLVFVRYFEEEGGCS